MVVERPSHYVRDRALDVGYSQTRTCDTPKAPTSLRDLAMSILRLAGFNNISSSRASYAELRALDVHTEPIRPTRAGAPGVGARRAAETADHPGGDPNPSG
jgi:hypothetical protein